MRFKQKFVLVIFLSLCFISLIGYFIEPSIPQYMGVSNRYPIPAVAVRETSKCQNMTKPYKILIWTNTHNVFPFYKKIFQKDKIPNSCPSCKCQFTTNKSEVTTSEVVVFSLLNLEEGFPNYRSPDQIWAVYNDEAPQRSYGEPIHGLNTLKGKFNMTITYRYDSDVVHPYGEITRHPNPPTFTELQWKIAQKMKTKHLPIAWVVSHCDAYSKRDVIVKEMKQYLSIDIYGKCGKLDCGKSPNNEEMGQSCWDLIEEKYYFYLSFENSYCHDYVTEKLYDALDRFVVPIVFAKLDTGYVQRLPPRSFINVADYDSVQELTTYLMKLINNPRDYESYFNWKLQYKVLLRNNLECDLCDRLHKGFKPRTYDIKNWWFNKTCLDYFTKKYIPMPK